MQLKIPINDEEAAFGAAIYGIVASKRFPDISSAVKSLVHFGKLGYILDASLIRSYSFLMINK